MNDSLIPERPIVVSPTLASSIGLEEAILLQHLQGLLDFTGQPREQQLWTSCSLASLSNQLPFWTSAAIRRILQNLVDLGLVLASEFPQQDTQALQLAINQSFSHQAATQQAGELQAKQDTLGAYRIPADWLPDSAVLAQLEHNGVERDFALAQVAEFVLYWRDRGEAQHSWGSKFLQHVSRRWQTEQNHRAAQQKSQQRQEQASSAMEKRWGPSLDAIEILERMGINRNFIDDAVAEFVLYWQERGEAQATWNSKFVSHVKRQWARYTNTLKHDTEPRRIEANWQPDQEVFDVLAIANIDEQFARELIPEFVIFWRDRNEMHHSWNTKYLQHVKYHWARRHQANALSADSTTSSSDGKQQRPGQPGSTRARSLVDDLTDRSWAS